MYIFLYNSGLIFFLSNFSAVRDYYVGVMITGDNVVAVIIDHHKVALKPYEIQMLNPESVVMCALL